MLRVLSLRLVLTAINSVQQAYVSREMIFKKFFLATLIGTAVSAVVGIIMAYLGFGVWAIVAQYLTNTIIDTLVLNRTLKKKLLNGFSIHRLKKLVVYGTRVLLTNLVITAYQEIRAVIIGKKYSTEDLAYFDKAKQFPSVFVTNINSSIRAVLFPKMSQLQDDIHKLKDTARKSIRFSSYILCPMLLGLVAVSKQFVIIILTEKWLPCVPFLQLLCINSMCLPLHSTNMQMIKAMGRSDIALKVEIIKKIIELIVLLIVMRISVTAIVVGMVACSISFIFINAYPNIKLIGYTYKEQLSDLVPSIMMSIIMAIVVYTIGMINIPVFILLFIQIIVGILLYIFMSIITKNEQFKYLVHLVKSKIIKK